MLRGGELGVVLLVLSFLLLYFFTCMDCYILLDCMRLGWGRIFLRHALNSGFILSLDGCFRKSIYGTGNRT